MMGNKRLGGELFLLERRFQQVDHLHNRVVARHGNEVRGGERGSQVALEGGRQAFQVLPFKRGLVEPRSCRDVRRHEVELLRCEQSKRFSPDLAEERALGDVVVREKLEYLRRFKQIAVARDAVVVGALLGILFGRVAEAFYVMQEALDQIVMELVVTVEDEAQQVDVHRPAL